MEGQTLQRHDIFIGTYLSKQIYKIARKELRAWRTLWSEHLLQRFRNTKYLQKVMVDPIQSSACPIEVENLTEFLEKYLRHRRRRIRVRLILHFFRLYPNLPSTNWRLR